MKKTYDVVIIGAGHNGLTAAAMLARSGRSVAVLDRRATAGGMIGGGDASLAHLIYNLSGSEIGALGLRDRLSKVDTVSLSATGDHVIVGDGGVTFADGRAHPETAEYRALVARLTKFAGLLAPLAEAPPPAFEGGMLSRSGMRELLRLGRLGLGLKFMGKADMREFLRILLSNAYDVLRDELDDGPLSGALAADAVRGSFSGPRSPGSVFSLMYRLGQGGQVYTASNGMDEVAEAYAKRATDAGAAVILNLGVQRIVVENDQVTGVVADDGTQIAARTVLSGAGPLSTATMAGIANFDAETVRRARNHRCKGTTAKVNFRLGGMPTVAGLGANHLRHRLVVAPTPDYVERSFNPAKYGEIPDHPTLEAVVTGPESAPLLSVNASHVPADLRGGWTKAARTKLSKTVLQTLAAHGVGGLEGAKSVLVASPADIQTDFGAPGGHWHHGEMGLDQILTLRPIIGMSRYRAGPDGLYLCGASAHPGGDITGAPGRNAAAQVIKDGVA